MRKLVVFFSLLLILFTSCQNPISEKRAKLMIKRELRSTMTDWSSYKSIQFGALDSAFTSVYQTDEYKQLSLGAGLLLVDRDTYLEKSDSLRKNFVSEFRGWSMAHIFEAKNEQDKLVIQKSIYIFDVEMEEIIDVEYDFTNLEPSVFYENVNEYKIK